ncbi:endonuclease/exonuclease/phosphatase family protein [Blastopirellula sp. JC732]|uniref:Endonuclease/exonuclease/phosphatase family protein n=1 Tax=Blastopirellula sediminis TaxID=2894196 RepID=A0A9X1SKF6_9BACT|nr:endonuclease/exonuclease/phosphatase family protein [Blastopirellula sediminis]MCC9607007.1 endonuclease/exonuclease/phosphatase family protein [Blastopirellula sediminis]MCC9629699.1 endonuclease/exonuclease/phosphatase family protein [Blastopirellula sediminis]
MSRFLSLACLASLLLFPSFVLSAETNDAIRVMSFNIRYGSAQDGENHWDIRKPLVVETIQRYNPDLLGTQECLPFQEAYLREQLPEYDCYAVSREGEGTAGEKCAVFFRKSRFELLEKGSVALSETPEKIGSVSWDSSLPRIASWVKLRDKESGKTFTFWNTHFDHRGPKSREEAAKLLVAQMKAAPDSGPVVLTGDFNTDAGSAPHKTLVAYLTDAWDAAKWEGSTWTFNGWKDQTSGARIDWILHSAGFTAADTTIDRWKSDSGHYPSDHCPVTTTLTFTKK